MSRSELQGRKLARTACDGAAIVEVALTLPILVLVSLATIDTCRAIFVRQAAKIAAFECARVGIIPNVERQQIEFVARSFLSSRSIKDHQLLLSAEPSQLEKGDILTVTVSVPANTNSLGTSWFYRNKRFDERVSILVEQ